MVKVAKLKRRGKKRGKDWNRVQKREKIQV